MAQFLTTMQTVAQLESMMRSASGRIVLISPYIQISENLASRLRAAAERPNVNVTVVVRERALRDKEAGTLYGIPKIRLYTHDRVHAKCYCSEDEIIVTSMNLYEYSAGNPEMSVLLSPQSDPEAFSQAWEEVDHIISIARQFDIVADDAQAGVCIRCVADIEFNPERPLCLECFKVWKRFSNKDYEEGVCHACGSESDTSMAKPLCGKCYKKLIARN